MDELDELEAFLNSEEKTCAPRIQDHNGDPNYYTGICTEIAYVRGKIADLRAQRRKPLIPAYLERADEAYDKINSIIAALPVSERKKLEKLISADSSCDDSCRRKHCGMKTPCCEE